MAFPSIPSSPAITSGTVASTSATVSLAFGVIEGDRDISLVIHRSAGAGTHTYPAGWNKILEDSSDASDDVTSVAWHVVPSTEGTTITVGQGNVKYASVHYHIRLAQSMVPPQIGTIATGTSVNPDPGALTPQWGSRDYLLIAVAAYDNEAANPPSVFPTNYTLQQGSADSGTGGATASNCRVSAGARQLTTGANQDPSAFTISVSSNWTAFTIAIAPREVPDVTQPTYAAADRL